ncbi:MAG: hypothetical protein Q8L27_03795 [archaeon]|nr:hypothetical protein [archaeon]
MDKTKIESGNLRKIKLEYDKLRVQYNLPDFTFMNETFEIESIEVEETELFIKRMRKHMTEKIFFVLRSLEVFLNPQNAPLFMMNVLKSLSSVDRESIRDLYKEISEYEIAAFGLEAKYDEKKEIEFIKKVCNSWKGFSEDLVKIYKIMKEANKKIEQKHSKSYLG